MGFVASGGGHCQQVSGAGAFRAITAWLREELAARWRGGSTALDRCAARAGHWRLAARRTDVEVAKWAGHSPAVCLGTYAHLFDTVTEPIDPEQAIQEARYGVGADQEQAAS